MLETHLRQAATILLESTIRIAPPDARDWGRGILGELGYVEGPWAVAMWAMGGASVLARRTLVSILVPGRRGQNLIPDGGLFARSFPLRKVTLAACGVFVMGALLFFFAPPFRQAVRLSLAAWQDVVIADTSVAPSNNTEVSTESPIAQVFGPEVSARNALVVHVSSLALLGFMVTMAVAGTALLLGIRKSAKHGARRSQPFAMAALLAGTLGFLISSATIYLTYRPYWYIYQHGSLRGNQSHLGNPSDFLTVAQAFQYYGFATANFSLYFWMGVILLGVIGLVLILLRHFLGRPPANASV